MSSSDASTSAHVQAISGTHSTARHPAVAPTASSAASQAMISTVSESKQRKRFDLGEFVSPQVSSYFIAGGVAGAASRTVVSPLERLKIIQ